MNGPSGKSDSYFSFGRPIFGWPIVLACFVGMFGNVGPLIYSSFAFLIRELETDFGWSRSDMTLSVSLLTLVSAVVHPYFGVLVDRYGVRRTLLPSLILMALILITVPLYLNELWQLWLAFILVAIFGVANNNLSFIRLISTWFDKRRGLMIGIIASGTGVGLAILPKITEYVVSLHSWQGGFIFYGMYILFFTVPVMFFMVRNRPEVVGLLPDGRSTLADDVETEITGLTLHSAMRTGGFWLLFLAILFASLALWGITNQMALLLTDRGYSTSTAASVAVSLGLSMAVARVVIGYFLDKIHAPIVGGIIFGLAALGFVILCYVQAQWAPFLAAVLIGAALGAETELMGYMVGRYFGLRHFGSIYGIVFVGFLIGTSGGPYLYAKTQEIFGSYDPALQFMIALMGVTAIMFASMGSYDRYRSGFLKD